MNSIKKDVMIVKDELDQAREELNTQSSLAYELLKDTVKASKRKDRIIVLLIVLLACSVIYTIYVLNDTQTTETTETYKVEQDSGDGGNNNFVSGNNNEVHNG